MEELIKITEQNGKQAVSARELHTFLESKYQFTDWVKERINRYELIENQDYIIFSEKTEKGRPRIEYALSIDCAKELSMVENNAKGKQARKYFIACEKKLKETPLIDGTVLQLFKDQLEASKLLNEGLIKVTENLISFEERISKLEANTPIQEILKPKRTRRKKFTVENPDAKGSTRDPFKINGATWYSVSIIRAMHRLTSKRINISKENRHELRIKGRSIGIVNSEGLKEIARQA